MNPVDGLTLDGVPDGVADGAVPEIRLQGAPSSNRGRSDQSDMRCPFSGV